MRRIWPRWTVSGACQRRGTCRANTGLAMFRQGCRGSTDLTSTLAQGMTTSVAPRDSRQGFVQLLVAQPGSRITDLAQVRTRHDALSAPSKRLDVVEGVASLNLFEALGRFIDQGCGRWSPPDHPLRLSTLSALRVQPGKQRCTDGNRAQPRPLASYGAVLRPSGHLAVGMSGRRSLTASVGCCCAPFS
jgi:hypothetical protein